MRGDYRKNYVWNFIMNLVFEGHVAALDRSHMHEWFFERTIEQTTETILLALKQLLQ